MRKLFLEGRYLGLERWVTACAVGDNEDRVRIIGGVEGTAG